MLDSLVAIVGLTNGFRGKGFFVMQTDYVSRRISCVPNNAYLSTCP